MKRIKIVVAEEHAVLRSGLCCLLGTQEDLVVRAHVGNGPEAVRALRCGRIDVLLMGLDMPGGGVSLIRRALRTLPSLRVLILSAHDDARPAQAALTAGAAGYLVKTASEQELFSAIRAVHLGRTFVDVHLRERRPRREAGTKDAGGGVLYATLSAREQETLALLARGHTNREIAARLLIGVKTVETYRGRVRDKLGLKTRAQVVAYALDSGLLGPEIEAPAEE